MAKEPSEYTEFTLYKGAVKGKFYPKSHQYWASIDGGKMKRIRGATSMINIKDKSRALGIWQQQVTVDSLFLAIGKGHKIDEDMAIECCIQHELQKEEAADIGKEIHGYVEALIQHELGLTKKMPAMPDFPEAVTGVNAFNEWRKGNKVKFVSTERMVFSKEYEYMGTLDNEAKVNGLLCLVDLKSSNGLYNGVRMQTAAYQHADEEENKKKKYDGRWALRLSKYTEKEYIARETRKRQIREAIARIKGETYNMRPIEPYRAFEAKFLDVESGFYKRDFKAFVNCLELTEWDRATDPYIQGANW